MNTASTNLSTTGSKAGSDAQDGLLTVKEACDALRVGRWTLYTLYPLWRAHHRQATKPTPDSPYCDPGAY